MGWGQEGCSRGPPRGSCLQPPFITSQPAPVSLLLGWGIQPEQQPSWRGLASTASPSAIAAALAKAIEMQDRLGSSGKAGVSSCTQGSPTLITIGCQGVYNISNSKGIRRDVPLDPGMCTELTRRLPRRWQAGFVFRRFGCTPGDKDLPQPSVRQPAHPSRERPRTSILSSPSQGTASRWSSPGVAPAACASRTAWDNAARGTPGGWFGSRVHLELRGLQVPAGGQDELTCMEKKLNEANQKNPKLMSRLEIISQNLFWLGVAALTCQTSGEDGSSGGGCCCPEGALEMKRGFCKYASLPRPGEGLAGTGTAQPLLPWEAAPSSSPARPDSHRSSPPASTRRRVPEARPLHFPAQSDAALHS